MRWWTHTPRGGKILFVCSLIVFVVGVTYIILPSSATASTPQGVAPIGNVATLGARQGIFWSAYSYPISHTNLSAVISVTIGGYPAGMQLTTAIGTDGYSRIHRIRLVTVDNHSMDPLAVETLMEQLLPSDAQALNVIGDDHPYFSPALAATFPHSSGTLDWQCDADYFECVMTTD